MWSSVQKVEGQGQRTSKIPRNYRNYLTCFLTGGRRRLTRRLQTRPNPLLGLIYCRRLRRSATGRTAAYRVGTRRRHLFLSELKSLKLFCNAFRGRLDAGLVRLDFGDGRYLVEDVTGYSERVWREDIITVNDELGKRYVIALHPHHQFRCRQSHAVVHFILSPLPRTLCIYRGLFVGPSLNKISQKVVDHKFWRILREGYLSGREKSIRFVFWVDVHSDPDFSSPICSVWICVVLQWNKSETKRIPWWSALSDF